MEYSFIIPVYNSRSYLPGCVESIRAAGVGDYEILLVDDGSTDGSGAVCDELAARCPEIRVIHQENGGASAARNRGIREARGEKLLFIDGDDTVDSAALAAVLADPRCDEADLVVYGIRFDYYSGGQCYRRDPLYYDREEVFDRAGWTALFDRFYARNCFSSMCTKIFRRSLLAEHALELNRDMFLYEDFEFVLRYLAHCGRIWNVPRAIYHYRQSEDEGNAKRRLKRIDCLSEFMQPVEAALDRLEDVPADQKEAVLVQLFQVLAREKISVSTLEQIRGICADYARWYRDRGFTAGDCGLHRKLMACKAAALLLADKKSALRHRIAVWAKAHHLYRRK